ncbi:MAG: replication initiator [Pseudonocardiaceae bacterium]
MSFVKVAEFQRRGVVHFHSLIRLDGLGEDYQPPQIGIDATGLAEAIHQAALHVRLTVEMPAGPAWCCTSVTSSTPRPSMVDRVDS